MSRNYHHGALAEAMVNQALADVRHVGPDRVSLRSISHALEVSPSAAYNHFTSKDELLRAVGRCGLDVLDQRMARALAAHPADSDEGAKDRFAALARAYIEFATEETHLFQLTFGPICAADANESDIASADQTVNNGADAKLTSALDELDQRGLLRPGVRPGLELTMWAATHGLANLIVEGLLEAESLEQLIASINQLVLKDVG